MVLALFLVLAITNNPKTMTLAEVDRELAGTVYGERGGWLFHQLLHYECNQADRKSYIREIHSEYSKLEREYQRLGGTFAPDNEQDVMEEATHYHCSGGTVLAERRWDDEVIKADASLARMKSLLDRKKYLLGRK